MNSGEATPEQPVALEVAAELGWFGEVFDDPAVGAVGVFDEEESLDGQQDDCQDDSLDLVDDEDFELVRRPSFC